MRVGHTVSRFAFLLIGILVFSAASAHAQPMITLEAGDLIVLDGTDDAVYHVDPVTGNKTELVSGAVVPSPRGVAVSPEGLLYVSDTANEWLIRLDPFTGGTVPVFVFTTPGGSFPDPAAALADAESNWDILVVEADQRQILRIDPALFQLGQIETQLVGTRFPIGLARDPTNQTLVVADRFTDSPPELAGIHRVDPATNAQSAVSLSAQYVSLRRVAVQSDGDILVTDRAQGGVSGNERVWRIPSGSAVPEVFGTVGASFDDPQGIAVDPADDSVYVTDFGTGELFRINAAGTSKTLVNGEFSGPFDVIVVPTLTPRDHAEFLISEADPGGTTGQVYRADSAADTRTPVAGGPFTQPRAMAFEHPDDNLTTGVIYVIDGPSKIVRRELDGGAQTVVSELGEFDDLSDIAVEFGDPLGAIVVTDRTDGQVIRVNPVGGAQTVLNAIPGTPTSIVVDGNGSLIVTATELDDDGDTSDDSGVFRVNPLSWEVIHFNIQQPTIPPTSIKFLEPFALALDPSSDVVMIDRGDVADQVTNPATLYLLQGTSNSAAFASAFPFSSTALDPALPDAVAAVVDGNRDPIVAFDAAEPSRVDLLTADAVTLMVGGNFNLATDLLFEGMPAPGDPVDSDGDSVPDGFDNCPVDSNPGQEDVDSDTRGDVCQLFDWDLDGWSNFDNCPFFPNADQTDTDEDGRGDACDNCTGVANPLQEDSNNNGIGNACEDSDGDFVNDSEDVCPEIADPGQADGDNDGAGDACDNCPGDFNPSQSDLNDDGFGDVCQDALAGPDSDLDGIPDNGGPAPCATLEGVNCDDNCVNDPNPTQSDVNADGIGDVCQDDLAGPDNDFDGWPDSSDNCPNSFNPLQGDLNEDGIGDACQNALGGPDSDLDGIPDDGGTAVCANGMTVACDDNCVDIFNPTQSDLNEDGEGDACQSADLDNDGVPDEGGPTACANGVTVGCDDNCPVAFNPDQGDVNGDLIGDACQPDDLDGDGWPDDADNCPYFPNPNQEDLDSDDIGDFCDNNTDADGLVDFLDNCPMLPNATVGGALTGTCSAGTVGAACSTNAACNVNPDDGFCSLNQEDGDGDGVGDVCDNCRVIPNGILQGTCFTGLPGTLCQADATCNFEAVVGMCSRDQEDQDSDDIGDVCDPMPIPEPGQLPMLLPALGLLALLHRRRSAAFGSR